MKNKPSINLALLHYPCVNSCGDKVATAAFPLDAQDIARSCATFGVKNFFIVHPFQKQRNFLKDVVDFWNLEKAWQKNESRSIALSRVKVFESLEAVIESLNSPIIISTSASKQSKNIINFAQLVKLNESNVGKDYLIIMGTGSGLHSSIFEKSDYQLTPLEGTDRYNHLSVRSAAAIILFKINEALRAL